MPDYIKYWKTFLGFIVMSIIATILITCTIRGNETKEALIYGFYQGWSGFGDFNGQYCNNIPSGIMSERYKKARLEFSAITKKKYNIITCDDYEVKINTNLQSYLNSKVTSLIGFRFLKTRGIGGNGSEHKGIDIAMNKGTPIQPYNAGKVVRIRLTNRGYGKYIMIKTDDGNTNIYGHLSHINVRLNQRVETNEAIGLSGNTGDSTGPHLHFEER
jgi:murein DD-endopeptidase MepM/ murein hydrolase activator NlpD